MQACPGLKPRHWNHPLSVGLLLGVNTPFEIEFLHRAGTAGLHRAVHRDFDRPWGHMVLIHIPGSTSLRLLQFFQELDGLPVLFPAPFKQFHQAIILRTKRIPDTRILVIERVPGICWLQVYFATGAMSPYF